MAGRVVVANGAAGFLMDRRVNDAFIAANRLMKANEDVYVLKSPLSSGGVTWPAGTWYVRARNAGTRRAMDSIAVQLGVNVTGVTTGPPRDAVKLRAARIGLWDQYGGSIDAGWARWIFEQYEFPFQRVFPQELDAGNLNAKYDVLVFVGGGIPGAGGGGAVAEVAGPRPTTCRPSTARTWGA